MTYQQEERTVRRILIGTGILLSIVALTIMNDIKTSETEPKDPTQVFVWNDDIKSVPIQGYIKVDTIINDTIYLSPDE
jgi:hypothetical protein